MAMWIPLSMTLRRLLALSTFCCLHAVSVDAEEVSFRRDIAPVLLAQCHGCHNSSDPEGSFRVDSFSSLMQPGDSGEHSIVAGEADRSELFRRLVSDNVDERMPLEGDPLSSEFVALVRRWIRDGAKYDVEDRHASLASILPITRHPDAPNEYRFNMPITAVAFVEDDLLVSGYQEILRWDWEKPRLLGRIPQVGQRVYAIDWDPLSNRIFIASGTPGRLGEVRVFDAPSYSLVGVPVVTSDVMLDVALSPRGRLLAAGAADARIYLVDGRTLQVVRSIGSHSDWVHGVSWKADGTRLASASRDRTAKLFDVSSGRVLATYTAHEMSVADIGQAEQTDQWVSCDAAGNFHLWASEDAKKLHELDVPGSRTGRVITHSSGVWCLSSKGLSKLAGKEVEERLHNFQRPPISASIHASGRWIATGDRDGHVSVWDVRTAKRLARFVPFPGAQPQDRQAAPRGS